MQICFNFYVLKPGIRCDQTRNYDVNKHMRGLCQLAIRQIEGFRPKTAEVLEETEAEALAYLDFPYEHHVGLRTDNVQERTDRELKRRSRVVQNASPPFLRLGKCRPRGPGGHRGVRLTAGTAYPLNTFG